MFFIKSIIIYSKTNHLSYLYLNPGLNIIRGESNTGKSLVLDCIDYLFGAKSHRFDPKLNINKVEILVDFNGATLTMSRDVDSTDIEVISSIKDIVSGTYKVNSNAQANISQVWLKLMGINQPIQILRTQSGNTQSLTLRTFSHLLLVDEDNISEKKSILAQSSGVGKKVSVSVMAALLYLATGENYITGNAPVDPKIQKAKREAVESFVNRSMLALEFQKKSQNSILETPYELQNKINQLLNEIDAAEGTLKNATDKAKEYAEDIYQLDNEITENKVLKNRNDSLMTQYQSDIRRLTFIAEGDIHNADIPNLEKCPFCNGTLNIDNNESCIEAAVSEVRKIQNQIHDLQSVQNMIKQESIELESKRQLMISKREEINTFIRGELKPKISMLQNYLHDYTLALNKSKEQEMIDDFSKVLLDEMYQVQQEETTNLSIDIPEKFRLQFHEFLNNEINDILKKTHYQNYVGSLFDFDNKDVIVNGHFKNTQGQGYRAFLNSIIALIIRKYLVYHGRYAYNLLVLDSPIQSLKESNDNLPGDISDTMKTGLFEYLKGIGNELQTIVIENTIPVIDYSGVNVITFTKDNTKGRYGLVTDYQD